MLVVLLAPASLLVAHAQLELRARVSQRRRLSQQPDRLDLVLHHAFAVQVAHRQRVVGDAIVRGGRADQRLHGVRGAALQLERARVLELAAQTSDAVGISISLTK